MRCPNCGAENREGSNFCRYCSHRFSAQNPKPNSGYVPSVPPPEATAFREQYPPVQQQQPNFQQPPPVPVPYVWGQLPCPRCGAISVTRGTTPVWAIVLAIVLALPTCFFSLFFLMIKDPNRCLHCGLEFRQ